jgi:hypothetical protein
MDFSSAFVSSAFVVGNGLRLRSFASTMREDPVG